MPILLLPPPLKTLDHVSHPPPPDTPLFRIPPKRKHLSFVKKSGTNKIILED